MVDIREITTVKYGLESKSLQMIEGDFLRLDDSEIPLLEDIQCIINDTNRWFSLTKYQIDEVEFAMKYGRILHLLKVSVLPSAIKSSDPFLGSQLPSFHILKYLQDVYR